MSDADITKVVGSIDSFKKQETTFAVLNLFVLASLLLIHTVFASKLGHPPKLLIIILVIAFLGNLLALIWVQGTTSAVSERTVPVWTWCSIAAMMTVAFLLALVSFRQDTQYFALMLVPILQAAFRLSLAATCGIVSSASGLVFFWVWNYFRLHPPGAVTEYFEAATISLIYLILGPLVWILVNDLRTREAMLANVVMELGQAEKRLVVEEKLAAVGRFSSAIAHEIRNPVAMISSALSAATRDELSRDEQKQMFAIAVSEAARLEKLTSDFLSYARPRLTAKRSTDMHAFIEYVASICRVKASDLGVQIKVDVSRGLDAEIDLEQTQQALLNLVMNAIDASSSNGSVVIRATEDDGWLQLDVENSDAQIPPETAKRVFEPFFTTKPRGTGLGLAIARSIARAHGGDLVLSRNDPALVRFSMRVPLRATNTLEAMGDG